MLKVNAHQLTPLRNGVLSQLKGCANAPRRDGILKRFRTLLLFPVAM